MPCAPLAGWKVKASMPAMAHIMRLKRWRISSVPCSVSGSCRGWTSAKPGRRATCSCTLGLYFMVQVPIMSAVTSKPMDICESRRKCLSTRCCGSDGSAGGAARRTPSGSAAATSPTASAMASSSAGGSRPRPDSPPISSIRGSSQRAAWKPPAVRSLIGSPPRAPRPAGRSRPRRGARSRNRGTIPRAQEIPGSGPCRRGSRPRATPR